MSHNSGEITWLESKDADPGARRLAGIAHDFRSPLNVIIGFSELMLDEAPGKINGEQRRALNDILNSGRRLLCLVDELFETPPRPPLDAISSKRPVKTAEIYYQP